MSYDCKRLQQEPSARFLCTANVYKNITTTKRGPSARLLRAANVYKNVGRLQLLLTYQQDDLSSKHQVLGLKFL